jgi:hypothetical protein
MSKRVSKSLTSPYSITTLIRRGSTSDIRVTIDQLAADFNPRARKRTSERGEYYPYQRI